MHTKISRSAPRDTPIGTLKLQNSHRHLQIGKNPESTRNPTLSKLVLNRQPDLTRLQEPSLLWGDLNTLKLSV